MTSTTTQATGLRALKTSSRLQRADRGQQQVALSDKTVEIHLHDLTARLRHTLDADDVQTQSRHVDNLITPVVEAEAMKM